MTLFPNLMRMAARIGETPTPVVVPPLELAGRPYQDAPDRDMPEGAPPWILAWLKGRNLPIADLFPEILHRAPDERAALLRFPPSSVVWCPCDCDTCHRWGVVLGVTRCEHGGVHLLLRTSEHRAGRARVAVERSKLLVVAFRGELTREAMRAVLAPEGEA